MPSAPSQGYDHRARRLPLVVAVSAVMLIVLVVVAVVAVSRDDGGPDGADDDGGPDGAEIDDPSDEGPEEPPAVSPPSPVEAPTWTSVHPYSEDSPWNSPIGDGARVHADSDDFVARIGGNITSDTSQYTLPVYEVDEDTPTAPVRLDHLFSDVTADGTSLDRMQQPTVEVPVPEGAASATGTDAQIVIVNTDTGEEWGFWHLEADGEGYRATNGYRYHVGANAIPPEGFGSRGAGVPYLTGLIRPADIERGRIDHAIAFAYPTPSPEHVFPATKSDGPGDPGIDLPEGARLRLDPSLDSDDFDELGLSEEARTIARALQEYGMILIDIAGRPKIYAEYEDTANWAGTITEDTVSALSLELFEVMDWQEAAAGPFAEPAAPDAVPAGSEIVLDGSTSFDPDGEVSAYEWTDAEGRVIGDEPIVRYASQHLDMGTHRFELRVANGNGDWSAPRQVYVEVETVEGPFDAAVYETDGVGVDRVELPTDQFDGDSTSLVAVTLRRLNEGDEVAVEDVTGGGGSWKRVVRELDERGTLALEIWTSKPEAGADQGQDVRIDLTSSTNVAAQLVNVANVGPIANRERNDTGDEPTSESEVAIDGLAGGLVLGFNAGRTEDFSSVGAGELGLRNTTADDVGGSVRLSSVVVLPTDDVPLQVGGTTRSPMDWLMAAVAFSEEEE